MSQTKAELINAKGDAAFDTDTLYIDSTNNRVGLGTSSPDTVFHTYGGFPTATIERNAGTGGAASIGLTNSTNSGFLITGSDTAFTITASSAVTAGTGLTERLRIDSSGRVGVGTTSPAQLLDVNGNIGYNNRLLATSASGDGTAAAPSICVGYDYDNGFFRPGTNTIGISTGGTERARIDSSGRLLLGTSSAGSGGTLSVNGTFSVGGGSTGAYISMSKVGMQHTSSVTTSAKTIFTNINQGLFAAGAHLVIYGGNNAGVLFLDVVAAYAGGTVSVISSSTLLGSPAARTYTMSTSNLQLQMASGTYSTNVRCTSMGFPF